MIMRILNKNTDKLRRFADWIRVSKMVKRAINEGEDNFLITGGGFCIRFKETKETEEVSK